MKVLIALLVVGAGLFFYPQFSESSSNVCAALEQRFARDAYRGSSGPEAIVAKLVLAASDGAWARSYSKSEWPNLPASIGCATSYYHLMMDPTLAKKIVQ